MLKLLLAQKSGRAGADAVGGIAERVVLAVADLAAVPAEGVDRAGPVAVVAGITWLADAAACPRMASVGELN